MTGVRLLQEHKEEETEAIYTSNIHGARCSYCGYAWTSDDEAAFWLDDSM